MVSTWSIAFSVITLLLSLVLPVVLAVWFCRKHQVPASAVLLGAITFLIFQRILRMPLMQALHPIYPGKEPVIGGWRLFWYGMYLSVSAALFEEGGRVVIGRLFLKKKVDWKNAIAFGIEKIIFVFYAFFAHFLLNFPLIYTQKMAWGVPIAMAYIGVMAVLSIYWVVRISPVLFGNIPTCEE